MLFSGSEPQSQKPKRPDAKTQDAESQRMSSQLVILFALFSNSSRTTYATAFTFSVPWQEVLPSTVTLNSATALPRASQTSRERRCKKFSIESLNHGGRGCEIC